MDMKPSWVAVTTCYGRPLRFRLVNSVSEASAFLFDNWPGRESDCWYAAIKHCNDALKGSVSVDDARAAFVVAAKDAGILHNADTWLR
jgi:hypothetical protein